MDNQSSAEQSVSSEQQSASIEQPMQHSVSSTLSYPMANPHFRKRLIGVFVLIFATVLVGIINQPMIGSVLFSSPRPTTVPSMTVAATDAPTITPGIPFSNKNTWLVELNNIFFTLDKIPAKGEKGRKDVTGRVFSPLKKGEYFCWFPDHTQSMYLLKQTPTRTWERLCDKNLVTSEKGPIKCERYDPEKGHEVYATFFPATACEDPGSKNSTGVYKLHVKVFTNCKVDENGMSNGNDCRGIVDADSPQFEVSK